jgi:hypothetical protein
MTTFNVVQFRVNPGMEQVFLDAHRDGKAAWPGLIRGVIIRTVDRAYVLIGEWQDMAALAGARQPMIQTLDTFRHVLEDLGAGLRVTDAAAGDVVLALT